MYSVRISLDYVLSEPLYFTQGVKLQNSKVGVKTDAELITTLYFADDKIIKLVDIFFKDNKMSLAKSKTSVISNATYDVSWLINDEII